MESIAGLWIIADLPSPLPTALDQKHAPNTQIIRLRNENLDRAVIYTICQGPPIQQNAQPENFPTAMILYPARFLTRFANYNFERFDLPGVFP
ncbi:MAG: hypothetical protein ACXW3Z_02120 [Limisphaerales bacterium]